MNIEDSFISITSIIINVIELYHFKKSNDGYILYKFIYLPIDFVANNSIKYTSILKAEELFIANFDIKSPLYNI